MSEAKQTKEDTPKEKAREEGAKLFYDALKHTTTLSTGAVIILITFLEKLFSNPYWRVLVPIALGSFFVSVVTSVIGMVYIADYVSHYEKKGNYYLDSRTMGNIFISVALFCFSFGILNSYNFCYSKHLLTVFHYNAA